MPLYRNPQTHWSPRLFWQMSVYVTTILLAMAAGALMPTLIAWRQYRAPRVPGPKVATAYAYCATRNATRSWGEGAAAGV